ncbi:cell division protein PerM [Actinacidiphila acidipaludis]|uniref:DUF6350 family protein n=1 Tax=Actinacidiphila acidipaludis TaxID=2873382 RepID=A0ABS7QES5_9ACTN|nr:DUF6350 family protein [Streptomyces acidipaludis]MBY8880427.1 DUF6350 family protein [Streptomyces acidipaludis]
MTHFTDPPQAPAARPEPHARWAAERVSALASGVIAAGLGLGVPAVAVLLLWVGSPYPDNGVDGALHLTAGLWLLSQGADLVRTGTISGEPTPVALAPLLLSAVPAWLLYRGTAAAVSGERGEGDGDEDATGHDARHDARHDAGRGSGSEPGAGVHRAAVVGGWVLTGYLAVAAVTVAYAVSGPIRVAPLTALYVPLFAAAAVACGAWSGCGKPAPADWLPLPRRYGEDVASALRSAAIGCVVLVGGGALVGGAALVLHGGAVARSYGRLSGPDAGRIAVLLLAALLIPNLAVWAASYALGVGFCVGAGSVVAPAGASGYPLLPSFPLLAALPGTGGAGVLGWATLVVPALAAGAVAWWVGGSGLGAGRTVRVACGAALFHGVGFAVAAAWAGGALGNDVLATFGPMWWRAGAAAAGWVLVIAVPGSLLVRRQLGHPARPVSARVPRPSRRPRMPRLPHIPRPTFRRAAVSPPPAPVPPPVADPLPWPTPPPFPPPLPPTPPSHS